MRISDWSSDVCSSDLRGLFSRAQAGQDTLRPGVVLQVRFAQIERARVSHVTNGMEGHAIVVAQRQIAWPTRQLHNGLDDTQMPSLRRFIAQQPSNGVPHLLPTPDRQSTRLNSSH